MGITPLLGCCMAVPVSAWYCGTGNCGNSGLNRLGFQRVMQSGLISPHSKLWMAVSPYIWVVLGSAHGESEGGERDGKRELIAPPLAPVPVADMKMLLVGKECPHTKEKSSGKQNKVSTSLLSSWGWVLGVGGWWQVA